MNKHQNIVQSFDSIINTLKQVEKSTEIFTQLKNITSELAFIEQYVIKGMDTLNKNYDSFFKGTKIVSDLVDFQKKTIQCKSLDELITNLFAFFKANIEYDHAFITLQNHKEKDRIPIISPEKEFLNSYNNFIKKNNESLIKYISDKKETSYLITDIKEAEYSFIKWQDLQVKSAIFFPLRAHGRYLGIGFFIRQKDAFEFNDLSFVNLIVGFISLLLFQNYFLSWLKSRLSEQSKLLKVIDDVKFNNYFENGPYYLFSLDPHNIIVHANISGENDGIFNGTQILGTNFFEYIPSSYHSGLKSVINSAQTGKISTYRSPLIAKNGKSPVMEFLLSRIELKDNSNLTVVLAVDITENFYKDLSEKRNEILDEMDQFSRILVSQFNNLLTTILPNITLLRNKISAKDPNRQQLDIIEKATKRSANLIQKFLNYGVEETATPEIGDLNKIISSFVNNYQNIQSNKIKVKLNLDPQIKSSRIFPFRIRKLLDILLSNSVLALQERQNPELGVSTSLLKQDSEGLIKDKPFHLKSGSYVELCVSDNGCGIPERSLNQVFKPFYSTRVKNEGVGLELFIAYNLVKDMKGHIFIDSEVDRYTKVYVYLPFKEEKDLSALNLEQERMYKESKVKQPTVLVVDDEYNIRSMMKEIMEMSGLRVFTAGNGRDGIDVYQRYKKDIDLIIMDIVMPIMDGRTAFKEIKKINPKQKIFIISGYSQRDDLEEMLQKGAVGYMRKPFQVKEIVDRVRDILNIKN